MNVRRTCVLTCAIALLVALSLPAVPAGATATGRNGLISFRRYFNADHTAGAIFVVNPDGTHETQITFPGPNQMDFTQNWSPDGTELAFERHTFTPGCGACETSQIWVANADGSSPHLLFPCPGDDTCLSAHAPAWSPDGTWVAFDLSTGPVTHRRAADTSIWAIHPDGSALHQITHPVGFQRSQDLTPQWSPDGTRIVFERDLARLDWRPGMFTADATDGSDVERVSPRRIFAEDHPDWSPNGRWIVYRSNNNPEGTEKVYLSHPDGTGFHVILRGGGTRSFTSSAFSPDGTALIIGIYPGFGPRGNADVWVGHLNRHERIDCLTRLTRTRKWESSPRWSTAPLLG